MNTEFEALAKKFKAIGADVVVRPAAPRGEPAVVGRRPTGGTSVDVRRVKNAEAFVIDVGEEPVRVLHSDPKDRHLLLLADGQKMLCGHDERHWFVAGVSAEVTTVRAAKISLLPAEIREAVLRQKRKPLGRRTAMYTRQGEWFFVPMDPPQRKGHPLVIHKNEPIRRNARSQPHICAELMRTGGVTVYLTGSGELSEGEYLDLKAAAPLKAQHAKQTVKNAEVYVRGRITHGDHATVLLHGWHRVYMNGEFSTGVVTFYD